MHNILSTYASVGKSTMITPRKRLRLAIIGAGPKGMALAAKAKVLSLLGFHVPEIIIFEKDSVGHNWTAQSGYTNGDLLLGTSPEKDVGFPYYSFCWGDSLNSLVNRLMKRFSWQSYLVHDHRFAEWIDRGKPAPTHGQWANYLRWVYALVKKDITLVPARVTNVDFVDGSWLIASSDSTQERIAAEGIVFTSPGNTHLPFQLPHHPHILRTENFWLNVGDFVPLRNRAIALIGAGENAATVAVTLGKIHDSNRIDVISPHAMNYTRGESYVENHIYTDPFQGNWHLFSKTDRMNFISRTDRGVFSVETKKELDCLPNVEVIPGECKNVFVDSLNQVVLDIDYNKTQEQRIYDLVVVTTGFDHIGFVLDLLSPSAKNLIMEKANISSLSRQALQDVISETLAIDNVTPSIHLPMLAGLQQGPGFPNLSSLGRLSDHILSHYVPLGSKAPLKDQEILRFATETLAGHHG